MEARGELPHMFIPSGRPRMINTGFSEITSERARYQGWGFWYCEIAVTGKCSFSCTYCNRLQSEINLGQICNFIDKYVGSLKHVQLTGGEPTEYPHIEELCTFIKERKIKLGISTNGSAPWPKYLMIDADMYSVSLDDYDESILVNRGYKNVSTVINTIKCLAKNTYVNVGMVIDSLNVDRINKIIPFILGLGVADIKLSVSTHDEVMPVFDDTDYSKYPILNYRVNRFRQGKSMRGLSDDDDFKCGLVLNDISIVGEYHYPCLVYAREKGGPIGSLDGSVSFDRLQWYRSHTPKDDPICQKYCMDFKCEFNREVEKWHSSSNH